MENVDKTIEAICTWIQKEFEKEGLGQSRELPEMITALASLISARANAKTHILSEPIISEEEFEKAIQEYLKHQGTLKVNCSDQ